MSFDVIVVNYNCYEALSNCLSGLEKWEPAKLDTIYVVDNSQVPLPDDLVRRFPGVTWLVNNENVGFARAVNQALAETTAPYVCLLNPDTVVSGPLWGPLEEWLKKNPHVGIVGPKILDADGSIQGSARAFPSLATVFFGRTSLISRLWPDNPFTRKNILSSQSLREPINVDWVSGACMIVRRSAVEDVGPMDQRFFLYWEDCDWCTRFRFAGWKVIYHPGLGPVIHHVGQASKNAKWLALYHFHRSAVFLYWKYDRTPARIGSLIALTGATLRCGALGLKLALR
ncbi:MAG: glycosyltransferase family 2 protein [Deltaproteobacteria bacterium]|nr:glycosyltransferase family 2 protein [Deltaproteobacteria bacterium]MBW1963849.1 glycosyltransferase family 2 protein [Deltaproteobacteria bacterium]MBW2079623.1 glycosyltransferase family 2 protein [Deltaproteobacteria bacterium]MBW2350483.1 glycosyltransferase family 2 protein [Deltaproteobacteria bacterium]